MKTIGLVGGMSWESTCLYYQHLNRLVSQRLGGLHSAKILMSSVDFEEVAVLQRNNQWDEAGALLSSKAQDLEKIGAEMILLCTNTMHKVIDDFAVKVPVLHIGDCVADAITKKNVKSVALLATRFTMEEDFYKQRLESKGLQVLIPGADDRGEVHRIIFDELCRGQISDESRKRLITMVQGLQKKGIEGVILGCTELAMILDQAHLPALTVFDTTWIHCEAAIQAAFN